MNDIKRAIKTCKNCKHGVDYGESVKYIYCEKGKRRKTVEKTYSCKDWSVEE